jgi:hypothetical protein
MFSSSLKKEKLVIQSAVTGNRRAYDNPFALENVAFALHQQVLIPTTYLSPKAGHSI